MKAQVWDPFVRIFHWTVATAFLVDYWLVEDGPVHRWIGYGVAGLIVARTVWGFVGSPHARFRDFAPTPARLKAHALALARGEPVGTLGHTPLGGLMILVLLTGLGALCVTGWMMRLDLFWGVGWVETTHEILADSIHVLVVAHIAAILVADIVHREGLIRAMLTGVKDLRASSRTAHRAP